MQRRLSHILLALVLALAGCSPRPRPPVAPVRAVRLLLLNDVYVLDTLRDGSGGLARAATLHRLLESEGPVIFLLAGDFLSPSLLSKWYSGRHMLEGLNVAGLEYATFGNHEFELDRDTLVARIAASRFRWISTNCTEANGSPFPGVRAWDTLTTAGVRVGIFAVTLPGDYRRYVRCGDPDSAASRAIVALRAAGAQIVAGLTHQTLVADSALLVREPELDLILGGHEHESHRVDIGDRLLLKADANSRSAQLATMVRHGNAWRTDARLIVIDRSLPLDSATQRVTESWNDSLARRLGAERIVGRAIAPIDARDALSRRGESPLGDLVTDAIRLGTGADVALINAGTLRLDDVIEPGAVTNYELESIFLFADDTRIVTFPLNGARLRELLEHGVSDAVYGRGGFLQVSGIRFSYDPSRNNGSRIVQLTRPDGRPIAGVEQLRVAFAAYPSCQGGDGYSVPEAASACADVGSGGAPRAVDLLLSHITERLRGTIDAPAAGRITRVAR